MALFSLSCYLQKGILCYLGILRNPSYRDLVRHEFKSCVVAFVLLILNRLGLEEAVVWVAKGPSAERRAPLGTGQDNSGKN